MSPGHSTLLHTYSNPGADDSNVSMDARLRLLTRWAWLIGLLHDILLDRNP
jgi:hypothetical protein